MSRLDSKGRCCGRKPLFYKGGSWRSPKGAPMHCCLDCNREFGPDGEQRENWAWARVGITADQFRRRDEKPEPMTPANAAAYHGDIDGDL